MKKQIRLLAVITAGAVLLTACGSSTVMTTEAVADTYAADGGQLYAGAGGSYEYEAAEEASAESASAQDWDAADIELSAGEAAGETPASKKLIRNVDLDVETRAFDELVSGICRDAELLGGYIENFSTNRYAVYAVRNGSITARVPSDQLDAFLGKVEEQSNVLSHSESVQDVTLQYVDLETHRKALITERDRLMELLEQAETVADIMEIESRLSEVRYQIESMEAQLRVIDNQVTYSTVYINIQEVEVLTPAADKSIWQEISEGFVSNVYRVLDGMQRFGIGILVNLPFILVWLAVIGIAAAVLKLVIRNCQKRRLSREIRRQKPAQTVGNPQDAEHHETETKN